MPGFFQVDVPAQGITQDVRGVPADGARGGEVIIQRLAVIRVHARPAYLNGGFAQPFNAVHEKLGL